MVEGLYNRICFSEWERHFIIGPGFTGGSVIFTYHSCNRMEFVFNNTTGFVMLIVILHPGAPRRSFLIPVEAREGCTDEYYPDPHPQCKSSVSTLSRAEC